MDEGGERPRTVTPWRLAVQLHLPTLERHLSRRPILRAPDGSPLVELDFTSGPALVVVAEASTEPALQAILATVQATHAAALVIAPPELARTTPALPRLRVVDSTAPDLRTTLARAAESLLRTALYRELRREWEAHLVSLRWADPAPPPAAVPEPRAPLATTLWAHARAIRGALFKTTRKTHVDLRTSPVVERRVRRHLPEGLAAAIAHLPDTAALPKDLAEIRRSLQRAETITRALADEATAQSLPQVGDPKVSLDRLEGHAIGHALEATARNTSAAARRLGVNRRTVRPWIPRR